MADAPKSTVDLGINGRVLEGYATELIYPGMLLRRLYETEPVRFTVQKFAGVDSPASSLIAVENLAWSYSPLDFFYVEGDKVYMRYCLPGDVFYGMVMFDEGFAPKHGDYLTAAGGGCLHKATLPLVKSNSLVGMVVGNVDPFDGPIDDEKSAPGLSYGRVPVAVR